MALEHRLGLPIEAELQRILESAEFRQSEQSKRFLKYLVSHSLGGDPEALRERAIGAEIFGLAAGYDTNENPIVRVRANEIRKRLAKYYLAHPDPEVKFEAPLGAYRIEFRERQAELVQAIPGRKRWLLPALCLGAKAIAFGAYRALPASGNPVVEFWGPGLRSKPPILLCTGHPTVYRFSNRLEERILGGRHDHYRSQTEALRLDPKQPLLGGDIIPIANQYIGLGTAHALARLSGWLANQGKESQIRFGNDLSFSELRRSPAVILGAFQNRWTKEFLRDLRFVFVTEDGVPGVRDTKTGKLYALPALQENGETPDDYVLISRVLNSASGEFVIAAAGITQYGGYTVAEVLTNGKVLTEVMKQAREGWQGRSLQILMHVKVIGQTPGPPEVLAIHEW